MAAITGNKVLDGLYEGYFTAGAPAAGTNAVQTLTIGGTPTAGTFKLGLEGIRTAAITWSATNATLLANMNTAMDAAWGTSSVVATAASLTAGIGTITLTFGANRAKQVVGVIVPENSLTGTAPTLAIANTTPGVEAHGRMAPKGARSIDTTNGKIYVNNGTPLAPDWKLVTSA